MKKARLKNKKATTVTRLVAFFFFLISVGLMLQSYVVFAATDGLLASTSSSNQSLDLTIPNLTKISDISDLNFGNYSGSGVAAQNDNVCVYTNNASGNYKITAKGNGTALAFTITNGLQTVPYTVKWNNAVGTSGNFSLTTNVASGTLSGANTSSQSCSGTNNANFEVSMTQGALMSVKAGTYTGILTLVIEPV